MLKAENDALRDDVAAGRQSVAHQSSLSGVSVRKASPLPPAWIMVPRLADTAERDYSTLRERKV